ncbi:UNVERIFIED_CONTAM: Cadherin-22, partial [Gekko kuhli]
IHSDSDEGDGSIKYTISGEGAGTIFLIDELTGDIHATERLDREQKTFYTLRAQARDRQTNQLLEPESEFVIKVQDVNDSEPRFLGGPYIGSVAELSPVGTSVMQVMASDADDPTYGSSARVVYSVLEGEQHFTVDSQTGVIQTAVANLDRETQDRYEVVIRATDMAGQLGGAVRLHHGHHRHHGQMYQFSIAETAPVGSLVGRVKAEDSDVGENTDMTYRVKDEAGLGAFQVTTDSHSQEALLSVQKPLDFEAQPVHTVVVEALNKFADPRFADLGTFRDQAIVRVTLLNVDEPPEFHPPHGPMEVPEDALVGSVVGDGHRPGPRRPGQPHPEMEEAWGCKYAIDQSSDLEHIFDIDPERGTIVTGKLLDRETAGWHNITVLAMEADNHGKVSRMSLQIRILDVNDNPPELATPYEAAVCEDAKPGELIHTISVVDRDEPQSGHHFYFTLAPEASGSSRHFSLLDITDNTAAVRTQRPGFNRQEQDLFLLPILVVDSAPPALSSTGTLTIRVCGCDSSGAIQSCNATAYALSASLSPGALIALLVCVLILVVLVLLILTLKRHQKGHLASEEDEDMRDNVIKYNDEGGGEQDTEAYDMSALRSLYDFSEAKGGGGGEGPPSLPSELRPLPQWGQAPDLDFSLFRDYISRKVGLADEDPSVPPYDSFQTYAFEGADSPLTSFSSINSRSTGSEQDFSYLSSWGPRFRQLAALYAGRRGEEDTAES